MRQAIDATGADLSGMKFELVLLGLVMPFVLLVSWPLLPYWWLEEVSKLVGIGLVGRRDLIGKKGWWLGLGFGLSEMMLYLVNVFYRGNFGVFPLRLLTTLPMHMLTAAILSYGLSQGGWRLVISVVAAVGIHGLFNAVLM